MDTIILQKLALERCRIHLSQLCAIMHLVGNGEGAHSHVPQSLHDLFEALNRDLQFLEELTDNAH